MATWPDEDDVKKMIGNTATEDSDLIEACLLAAISYLTQLVELPTDEGGDPDVPPAVNLACRRLTARLFAGKQAPLGVAGFNEQGAVRLAARDADVDALISPWRIWGIAG